MGVVPGNLTLSSSKPNTRKVTNRSETPFGRTLVCGTLPPGQREHIACVTLNLHSEASFD